MRAAGIGSRRALLRFALAHHPTCSVFRQDVVASRWPGRRAPLCAGCVTFWPTLLVGFPILLLAAHRYGWEWWQLALGGLLLASTQAVSYVGATGTRTRKLVVKGLVGCGAAAVMAGLALAPWSLAARVGALVALMGVAAALQGLRLRKVVAACAACPWQKQWQACPGFAPLNDHRPGNAPDGYEGRPEDLPRAWPW